MSDPMVLLADANIARNELSGLITQMGGDVEMPEPDAFVGTLQRDDGAIWIGLSPNELEPVIETSGNQVTAKLGVAPSTLVIVEMLSNAKSWDLAIEFAISFTKRWPAICSDGQGGFLSHHELLSLYGTGRNLALYPTQ